MNDPNKQSGIEASAISLLKRAVELDVSRRFDEAVTCYQEGMHLLMEVLKVTHEDAKKVKYRQKITEYLNRAEELKLQVQQEKESGKYHEQIQIADDSIGYSYEKLFSRFFDKEVTIVEVEDPYIRSIHQIFNFLRLCEVIVKQKTNVQKIKLLTGVDKDQQKQVQQLQQIGHSLKKHNITLDVEYSPTLHDRQIKLNNGWVIKIGRGLDIYKPTDKFSIGYCDYELRKCHETTIDIFHSKQVRQKDPT